VKHAGLYLTNYAQTYSEDGLAQSRLWPEGTLCITIAANIADTSILKIEACFPDSVIGFIPETGKADARFVKYLFDAMLKKKYKAFTQGATQDNLSQGKLLSLKFPVPDITVQEEIANILSTYDDHIENNKRRIELLEESARQLYKEWFVRFRFPGHEHVKIIDGVPEGWEYVELQDVCERITDGAHHSPKGVEDGLPMASVKDMHSWGMDLKKCRKISSDDFISLEKNDCRPKRGDVLIAKDGSYLKHVFVAEEDAPYVLLSSVAILRPNARIKSNQLAMFLSLPQTKKSLSGYVSGVALPRIILKEFRKFSFLCAPIKLQDMWAENYDCLFNLCRTLIKENERLAEARDVLLPKLMNREVAV
jgi:type I restriction enzyme S subunit